MMLSEAFAEEIATVLKPLVVAEAKRLEAARPQSAEMLAAKKEEAEIMRACKAVAAASDALAQAEFGGLGAMATARKRLIAAAAQLRQVMAKHGRLPGGE